MKKLILFSLLFATFVSAATLSYKTGRNDTLSKMAGKLNMSVSEFATQFPDAKLQSRQTFSVNTTPTPPPTPEPPVPPTPPAPPTPPTPPVPSGNELVWNAYITGYSYWDNTPPGSADIALPVIHSKAGGTGTYADPITMAVGHSITNGKSTPDFPKGTIFYLPYLQRYFIVEDVCGDGSRPQNGPCHIGYPSSAKAWLDIWIDGQDGSRSATDACMNKLTDVHQVIQNPNTGYPVIVGSVFSGGKCNY